MLIVELLFFADILEQLTVSGVIQCVASGPDRNLHPQEDNDPHQPEDRNDRIGHDESENTRTELRVLSLELQ